MTAANGDGRKPDQKPSWQALVAYGGGMVAISGIVLLQPVFAILKFTGAIGWSWWWVLSPLWCGGILLVGFMVIFPAAESFLWSMSTLRKSRNIKKNNE